MFFTASNFSTQPWSSSFDLYKKSYDLGLWSCIVRRSGLHCIGWRQTHGCRGRPHRYCSASRWSILDVGHGNPVDTDSSMTQFQCTNHPARDSHYKDKMVSRPSYLYNGNSHLSYWTRLLNLVTLLQLFQNCIWSEKRDVSYNVNKINSKMSHGSNILTSSLYYIVFSKIQCVLHSLPPKGEEWGIFWVHSLIDVFHLILIIGFYWVICSYGTWMYFVS